MEETWHTRGARETHLVDQLDRLLPLLQVLLLDRWDLPDLFNLLATAIIQR